MSSRWQQSENSVIIVQGAFYGSEAKGAVTAALCLERQADICVRTGTVNAGHTVLYNHLPHKMQQLPVGWVNPQTALYLGPGAYIHPEILAREIADIKTATGEDIRQRLFIDHRCGLHLSMHTSRAQAANRHHSMGATGKGCSEAVISKIRGRGSMEGQLFADWLGRPRSGPSFPNEDLLLGLNLVDTVQLLNSAWDEGAKVIIEGTQGTLLDLHTGPYPYTTHKQTLAGSWCSEAGLSPALPYEICLVARTFPIRVAGNSGPMPGEISWPTLARRINRRLGSKGREVLVKEDSIRQFTAACKDVAAEYWQSRPPTEREAITEYAPDWEIEEWHQIDREQHRAFVSELHAQALEHLPGPVVQDLCRVFELTTVTRKLRRVAELDLDSLRYSCVLNRPAYLALTFINHVYPETWGVDSWARISIGTLAEMAGYCTGIESSCRVPIRYVTTGPETSCLLPVSDIFRGTNLAEGGNVVVGQETARAD